MTISVNGIEISAKAVAEETMRHTDAPNPRKAAIEALVLRELLLQTARSKLGGDALEALLANNNSAPDDAEEFVEDVMIERLIEQEVAKPQLSDDECATYYQNNPAQFHSGEMVEASHILFGAATGQINDELRQRAAAVLQQAVQQPEQFAELARAHSTCPSASLGGNLGQLTRGQTVPEFEQVVFNLGQGKIAPELVETRFGLHIVMVAHRVESQVFPFEMVREELAAHLLEQKGRHALRHYLRTLLAQADVQGVETELA
ncbi:MAG TPA: peptidylprolyl isomerase [Gallionellaceae bacterium]|nr:peptidylprolyl isomerase [Gallionellaceae bacterium]